MRAGGREAAKRAARWRCWVNKKRERVGGLGGGGADLFGERGGVGVGVGVGFEGEGGEGGADEGAAGGGEAGGVEGLRAGDWVRGRWKRWGGKRRTS